MTGLRVRLPLAALALLAIMVSPGMSSAKGTEACLSASEQGQVLRDEGALIEAREKFLICSKKGCPGVVRKDCTTWLADVDRALPSVVVRAIGPDGTDVTDVRVSVDGKPLVDKLDGRPVPVNPGAHVIRYERAGGLAIEEKVLLREGEQGRQLTARFEPPKAAPAPVAKVEGSSVPAGVFVLGGLALAGGGAFAYFATGAKKDVDEMRSTCAPDCAAGDVDAARTKLIVADVALGVGVAAAASAVLVILLRSSPEGSAELSVRPAVGGGFAGVSGRF